MTWLPHRLVVRVALAMLVAATLVFALQQFVAQHDAEVARTVAAMPRAPERRWPGLGFRLDAVPGVIGLAEQVQAIASDVAPVVEVFADGGVALRRPAPLPLSPAGRTTSSRGIGAAILLPTPTLAALSPRSRAALLDLLQQLIGERPVSAARLRALDLTLEPHELQRLLAWVP